jgi:dTDP-4-amino-4,6-dideoxygalactose transaminase
MSFEPVMNTSQEKSVPFFNYKFLWESDGQTLSRIFENVCSKGAFILQKELSEFELNLARFSGCKYALGVADGTEAITIALLAAGLQQGEEVIFCSHTFIATASAIHHAGGIPVPVECSQDRLIDFEKIESAITDKTAAIVPTQLNGRICNMDALQNIAERHDLFIVEDAAQALGAKYKGKCAGTFGKAATLSFYPAKSLGCLGDGGAILTNDGAMYEKMKLMRDHGRGTDGEVHLWGFNSRLDNLQAAVLDFKLKNFENVIKRRRRMAEIYDELLSGIKEIGRPPAPDNGENFDTYQNYEVTAERRDDLRKHLTDNRVGTAVQWGGKAVHQFSKLGFAAKLPFTEKFFKECLLLPMNMSLSDDDVVYVSEQIRKFY